MKKKPRVNPFCKTCGTTIIAKTKAAFCSPEHKKQYRKKYRAEWFQRNKERLRVRQRYLDNQERGGETE